MARFTHCDWSALDLAIFRVQPPSGSHLIAHRSTCGFGSFRLESVESGKGKNTGGLCKSFWNTGRT